MLKIPAFGKPRNVTCNIIKMATETKTFTEFQISNLEIHIEKDWFITDVTNLLDSIKFLYKLKAIELISNYENLKKSPLGNDLFDATTLTSE